MRYQFSSFVAVLGMFLLAAPAVAQSQLPAESCGDEEIPVACFQRLLDASDGMQALDTKVAAAEAQTEAMVSERGAGVQAKTTPVNVEALAASSLTDFLSKFVAGAGIGSFDDNDDSWTFKFNPWSPYKPASKSDWLVTVTAQEPELFPPLGQALTDGDLSGTKEELSGDLGELDDIDLAVSWNRRSEKFSRDFRSHKQLISDIYSSVVTAAVDEVTPGIDSLIASLAAFGEEIDQAKFKDMPPSTAAEVERLVVEAATQEIAFEQSLDAKLQSTGFRRLSDLINNQPQLKVTGSYRSRAEAVGPDEVTGRFTAEIGLLNVRTFKTYCADEKRDADASADKELDADAECLGRYTQKFGDAIATAPRFSLSVEYADVDDFDFSLPDDDFEFRQDGGERIVGSLSYGMYLRPDDPLESRFELDASYEDVEGDTMRQDRFVATATFIQKLSDGTATSLSLVYANKPEYLGEVDEELSARVGLRYSLGGKKKE